MRFRFTLRPTGPGWSNEDSMKAGLEANTPTLWRRCAGPQDRPARDSARFMSIEPANVILSTVKPAYDGEGWTMRFLETAGKSGRVVVTMPSMPFGRIASCDLAERPAGEWREISGRSFAFETGASGVTTLRVK